MKEADAEILALDPIATQIVDAAFKVYKSLGPGLLESVYEACLVHELAKRGLKVQRQISQPIYYDSIALDAGFRIDILVENAIIIELKAVEKMIALYDAQLMTYLRLSKKRLGFLINFNVPYFKDGIKRIAC